MKVDMPSHWTKQDIYNFLKYLEEQLDVEPKVLNQQPKRSCSNCGFFKRERCVISSCSCATAVFNHESPPRWISKETV